MFEYKQRPNTKEYDANYIHIFGNKEKKDIKIKYQRNPSEQEVPTNTSIILIDDNGQPINNPNVFHRNKLYKQVKELRENLKESMCTKSECWIPNKENVNKMIREMRNPKIRAYKMAMQVIGAEPKDCNPELLRKGR